MVPCNNDCRDLSDAETFELGHTKADSAVGGMRAVEEITRMDDIIGFGVEYRIDHLCKGIVKIGFSLIDTVFIDDLKIVKPKMGVGEVEYSQLLPS